MVPRVLLEPGPRCLVTGYGDSSVNFDLRLWIDDPENSRGSVISDVLLGVWDQVKENGISIPYPHIKLRFHYSNAIFICAVVLSVNFVLVLTAKLDAGIFKPHIALSKKGML